MNDSGRFRPLISVITVCRNAEEFLKHCMRSVLEQDFDDFEYVLVDGGSTDETVNIIRRHESGLAYWHSRPDRGLAHAFNQAVEHSRGRWLLFLNSDDYFVDRTALSRMSGSLAEHKKSADVVFGQVQLVTREENPRPILLAGKPWNWDEFRRQDTIPHQGAFTNRDLFERVGPFSEDFKIVVDYEHYLRVGSSLSTVFVPETVACMRTDGMTRSMLSRTLREMSLAQRRHKVWPGAWMADALYAFYLARGTVGRALRKLLGTGR